MKKLIKYKGWSITRANNYLDAKFIYDKEIHDLMEEIINESPVRLILNRNPTICYGSIFLMKIRKIKPDPDDMTLAIPSSILPFLNADFDGDELNSIALNIQCLEEFFWGFNPWNMIIDRTNQSIKMDVSALENISIAIFSDR